MEGKGEKIRPLPPTQKHSGDGGLLPSLLCQFLATGGVRRRTDCSMSCCLFPVSILGDEGRKKEGGKVVQFLRPSEERGGGGGDFSGPTSSRSVNPPPPFEKAPPIVKWEKSIKKSAGKRGPRSLSREKEKKKKKA